jgi:hypothetical protein
MTPSTKITIGALFRLLHAQRHDSPAPPPPPTHTHTSRVLHHAQKLRKAHEGKPADMTLQELVQAEIDAKTTGAKNSSTDALLWLKRALLFIREFMGNVTEGDRSEKGSVKVRASAAQRTLGATRHQPTNQPPPIHCFMLC